MHADTILQIVLLSGLIVMAVEVIVTDMQAIGDLLGVTGALSEKELLQDTEAEEAGQGAQAYQGAQSATVTAALAVAAPQWKQQLDTARPHVLIGVGHRLVVAALQYQGHPRFHSLQSGPQAKKSQDRPRVVHRLTRV